MLKGRRTPKWVDGSLRCSFCGRPKDNVQRLIAGPGVYICDRCVDLCKDILEGDQVPAP